MEELDIKQYKEILDILKKYKELNPLELDIKVIFKSSESTKDQSFASLQFPVDSFDENMFLRLKEYAQVDYELCIKNDLPVGRTTKYSFAEPVKNIVMATYDYNHDTAFLEEMINTQIKK